MLLVLHCWPSLDVNKLRAFTIHYVNLIFVNRHMVDGKPTNREEDLYT